MSVKCPHPACPESDPESRFDSERGMRVHHSLAHGESLTRKTATCTTDGCEQEFEYYPSNKEGKFCPSCVEERNLDYSSEEPFRVRVECNGCGQEFDKVHSQFERTETHYCSRDCFSDDYTVPDVTLECDACGESFTVPEWLAENRKYCSAECLHGRKERRDVVCEYCGDVKSVLVSDYRESRNYFCSQQCYQTYRTEEGRVSVACENCGEDLVVRCHRAEETDRVFCDTDCRIEWQTSDSNPRYVGGLRGYGAGWHRARKQVLDRDDYECQICGCGIEALGREPDVHHITPVARFHDHPERTKADAHYTENLISLCRKHHRLAEENRDVLLQNLSTSLLSQLELGDPPGMEDH